MTVRDSSRFQGLVEVGRWGFAVLAVAGPLGCAGSTAVPAASAAPRKGALIAQPCAGVPANESGPVTRVQLEIASVPRVELPRPPGAWLAEHPIDADTVSNMMLRQDAPTTLDWRRCIDAACSARQLWTMTVTPHFPAKASDTLTLDVELRGPEPREVQSFTVPTTNQSPAVVDVPAGKNAVAQTWVVFPYFMGDETDRQNLGACRLGRLRPYMTSADSSP